MWIPERCLAGNLSAKQKPNWKALSIIEMRNIPNRLESVVKQSRREVARHELADIGTPPVMMSAVRRIVDGLLLVALGWHEKDRSSGLQELLARLYPRWEGKALYSRLQSFFSGLYRRIDLSAVDRSSRPHEINAPAKPSREVRADGVVREPSFMSFERGKAPEVGFLVHEPRFGSAHVLGNIKGVSSSRADVEDGLILHGNTEGFNRRGKLKAFFLRVLGVMREVSKPVKERKSLQFFAGAHTGDFPFACVPLVERRENHFIV